MSESLVSPEIQRDPDGQPKTALLYKVDGTVTEVKPENSKDFKFKELCRLMSIEEGYLQCVPLEYCVGYLFCHEEGKLRGLPENPMATVHAWVTSYGYTDVLVGDCMVIRADQLI